MAASVKAWVLALIADREREAGSRMVAYADVAREVGVSKDWLRKFATDHADVKELRWSIGWNVFDRYQRLCERIEADTAVKRMRVESLRKQVDAVDASVAGLGQVAVARASRRQRNGKAREWRKNQQLSRVRNPASAG
jgi:hypothetical protein